MLKTKIKEILQKIWEFLFGNQEHIFKWPYIFPPNKKIYRLRPQYLYGRLPDFELQAIIWDNNEQQTNSSLNKTSRTKIRIYDYYNKKNLFLIFFPGSLSQTPKGLLEIIHKLNMSIEFFNKYNIEVLFVVQSLSLEIRWILNLYLKEKEINNLFFPIIIDPWGLFQNAYNTLDNAHTKAQTNSYTLYLSDKKLRIRHIESLDKKINFNMQRTRDIITKIYHDECRE